MAIPKGWAKLTLDATDPNLPTLYMRPGSIIPLGPPREYTGEKPRSPLWLIVNLDSDHKASGNLYEDAGDGFGYKKGDYIVTRYDVAPNLSMGVDVIATQADGKRPPTKRQIIVSVFENGAWRSTGSGTEAEKLSVHMPVGQKHPTPEQVDRMRQAAGNRSVGPIYTPSS